MGAHHPPNADMKRFIEARSKFLHWRRERKACLKIVETNFPQKHVLRKALASTCLCEPLPLAQVHADDAACCYADRHGDHHFELRLDGGQVVAPTGMFYGSSLPDGSDTADVCKTPNVLPLAAASRILALEGHAEAWVAAVFDLPGFQHRTEAKRRISQSLRSFHRGVRKVKQAVGATEVDKGEYKRTLVCLQRGLVPEVADQIVVWL